MMAHRYGRRIAALGLLVSAIALASPAGSKPRAATRAPAMSVDARARAIVAGMTLEQKVGQMTQPSILAITPDEVRRYYIGSILNGGGGWPNKNKHSTVADWRALASQYRQASLSTDMKVRVPVVWGTDAVHGHNNIFGATLFPQNIGLGAAHDPALVRRIGRATAAQVRATGIQWAFAPTLAVVQNPRWGRTYESYSSDPREVEAYAQAMVDGLQGTLGSSTSVLATAKHFLGDGGTWHGIDQGETRTSMANLVATHGAGYRGAIRSNVQTAMISYSSFTDTATGKAWGKMSANRALVTGLLRDKMGFDGLVVSDWNAIGQVPGCTDWHCPAAINAGIDLMMVSDEWKKFIESTIADVKSGAIPMSRIDDAARRIIAVKLRAGLFDEKPGPGAEVMNSPAVEALAREAVRKSVVLLKNDRGVLPLRPGGRILVVGRGADSLPLQTGGWSLTWQGDQTDNRDYPNAHTLLAALRQQLGAQAVDYSVDGTGVDPRRYSAIVNVAAENPYAEMKGDVVFPAPFAHTARYPQDLAALERVSGKGVPVVTLLFSGRPVPVNDLINRSDAFVAAFLPGTEGEGLTDLLLAPRGGRSRFDFTGRLSFDWPAGPCLPQSGGVQFRRGYGLSLASRTSLGQLPVAPIPVECPADSR
ncbi:glycoside hydrolase family 3 protein [Sphingomonas sp. ASV193]|uniref:glycoside hydrolase family 3 protein n=1 Tax=Sphingomonas sp. ASV193 TaxID=3144405 RepID=UPI0032E876A2